MPAGEMEWEELCASWLRERAGHLRSAALSVESAYSSPRLREITARVAAAYNRAAQLFEDEANELWPEVRDEHD